MRSGREWWQMKSKFPDAITFKLINKEEISEESNFVQCYNLEK